MTHDTSIYSYVTGATSTLSSAVVKMHSHGNVWNLANFGERP